VPIFFINLQRLLSIQSKRRLLLRRDLAREGQGFLGVLCGIERSGREIIMALLDEISNLGGSSTETRRSCGIKSFLGVIF
jgi:hypothetical protein